MKINLYLPKSLEKKKVAYILTGGVTCYIVLLFCNVYINTSTRSCQREQTS